MKERMIPVTCPHCGHVFEIKRDTVVIAQMDSVARSRLDDGSYFMHQCQNCKVYVLFVLSISLQGSEKEV